MKHLEPVVKKSSSYSVLFLRDDSSVVRFRLKPLWIKFLAVVFFVFSGMAGASGYAAHYYWKRYNSIKQQYATLEAKFGEHSRKLAAYSGVEMIKESAALPRSAMTGVISLTANGKNGAYENGGSFLSGENGTQSQPYAVANAAPVSGNAGEQAVSGGSVPGAETPGTAEPVAAGANTPLQPVLPAVPSATESGLPAEHPALISEVAIRPDGTKNFSLGFDLSNRDQILTLNGRVLVSVGTKAGERLEVTQINRNAMRFIINRYKRVSTSFALPDGVQPEDVTQLFLTVTADDQPDITYAFPVPSPAS